MTSPIGFRGNAVVPNLPTPPTGFAVAAYPTYASAQAAVEHLIKHNFSIQDVTIVGSDLQMVERVTGRMTAGKLAAAAAASGAWMGLFVGLLMFVFAPVQGAVLWLILAAVAIGAAFGAVMGYLGFRWPRAAGISPQRPRWWPAATTCCVNRGPRNRPGICCPGWNWASAADQTGRGERPRPE